MAKNEIGIVINIDGKSIPITQKQAAALKKELDGVTTSAKNADKAVESIGGSKAAGKAFKSTMPSIQENIDYRNARGVAGTGGGGSRDFAKQAQGLGGLVHLYATFAANIFAVSAAYTAMGKAFELSRLEQASEIMSTKLGMNLKSLAKDLQEVTNMSMSFKDAMTFTNMGVSAGLSAKQIKNLTVIAKGASNALGRDMNDAIQRIIRGTAKQEQEILDELGIFVRAKQAYKEYAQMIGVANEEQLTGIQRTQAYAMAVEKAGEKWKEMAKIDDPFTKFTASLVEAGTELLSFINTALVPLINYLAEFKSVIEGIIVLVSAKLVRMAFPLLKESLSSLFMVDTKKLEERAKSHAEAYSNAVRTQLEKTEKNMPVTNLRQSFAGGTIGAMGVGNFLAANIERRTNIDSTNSSIKAQDALLGAINSKLGVMKKSGKDIELQNSLIKQKIVEIDVESGKLKLGTEGIALAEKEVNTVLVQQLGSIQALKKAQLELNTLKKESALISEDGRYKGRSEDTRKLKVAESVNRAQLGIAAAATATDLTVAGRIREVYRQTSEGMSNIATEATKAEKAVGGLKLVMSGFSRVLGVIMGPLGLLFTGWAIWDMALKPILISTGLLSKEVDNLSDKISQLKENAELFNRVFQKQPGIFTSVATSLDAVIEKYTLLTNRIKESIDNLEDLKINVKLTLEKQGMIDRFFNQGAEKTKEAAAQQANEIKGKGGLTTNWPQEFRVPLHDLGLEFEALAAEMHGGNTTFVGKDKPMLMETDEQYEARLSQRMSDLIDRRIAIEKQMLERDQKRLGIASSFKDTPEGKAASGVRDISQYLKNPLYASLNSDKAKTFFEGTEARLSQMDENFKAFDGTSKSEAVTNTVDYLSKEILDKLPDNIVKNLSIYGKDKASLTELVVKEGAEGVKKILKEVQTKGTKGLEALDKPDKPDKPKDFVGEKASIVLLREKKQLQDNIVSGVEQQIRLEKENLGYAKTETINSLATEKINAIGLGTELAKLDATTKFAKLKDDNKGIASEIGILEAKTLTQIESQAKEQEKNAKVEQQRLLLESDRLQYTKNVYSIQESQNKLDQDILEDKKALGEISEKDYLNKLNSYKIDAILYKLMNDTRGLELEEQLRLDEIAKKEIESLKREESRNIELLKRKQIEEGYQNTLEEINQSIEEANKSFEGRVKALSLVSSKEKEISKMYMTRMVYATEETDKMRIKLELQRELVALYNEELDAREKAFFDLDAGNQLQTIFDEAQRQYSDFYENVTNVVKGTFDSVYSGMDAAIDELADKIMRSETISLSSLWTTFRNTAAEMFRNLAADYMKLNARELIKDTIGKVFEVDMASPEEKAANKAAEILKQSRDIQIEQADYLQIIAEKIGGEGSTMGIPRAKDKIPTSPEEAAEQAKGIVITKAKEIFNNGLNYVGKKFLEVFGSDGIVVAGFRTLGNWIAKLLNSLLISEPSSAGGGLFNTIVGGIASAIGGGFGGITDTGSILGTGYGAGVSGLATGGGWDPITGLMAHAKGGIMSKYGPLEVNAYASGGIATNPGLYIAGEGGKNEAIVPLPDNRSIPVTLNGNQGGNTTINITVNDNSSSSSASSDKGNVNEGFKEFANLISVKVQEEMVKQKRPGGLLYAR